MSLHYDFFIPKIPVYVAPLPSTGLSPAHLSYSSSFWQQYCLYTNDSKFLEGVAVKNTQRKTATEMEAIQADSLFYQGELHTQNDNLKKALIYYKASERIARSGANHNTVLLCLLKQAQIHLRMKNCDQAAAKSREGLAYARLLERDSEELDFILLQSRALRESGKLTDALASIFEGIELSSDARLFDRESDFVIEMAEVSLIMNDTQSALLQATSLLRRAILFNNTDKVTALAALVDRISNSQAPSTPVTAALKKLPPLKAALV